MLSRYVHHDVEYNVLCSLFSAFEDCIAAPFDLVETILLVNSQEVSWLRSSQIGFSSLTGSSACRSKFSFSTTMYENEYELLASFLVDATVTQISHSSH